MELKCTSLNTPKQALDADRLLGGKKTKYQDFKEKYMVKFKTSVG